MSHPDPCYDSENSEENDMIYDDFDMQAERNIYPWIDDPNYDDHNDFYGELVADDLEDSWDNESMDGDFDSAMRDAGFGTDEDYGLYDG